MMGLHVLCLQYFFVLSSFPSVISFNIDVQHKFLEYSIGDKLSQFGYAISLINNDNTPLIVGAPNYNNGQGAIFKCGANCSEVVFNAGKGSTNVNQITGQKFGFSLSQAGKKLMACAPKFKILLQTDDDGIIPQPLGKCSVFDKDMKLSYNEIPCEDTFEMSERNAKLGGFGYCLAGTSSTGLPVEDNANEPVYFLGTPGARHLIGRNFAVYSEWGPIPSGEKIDKDGKVIEDFQRNSYIGYSVSAGNIIDRKKYGDVMAGGPRGNDMTGQALLYKLISKYDFYWKVNIPNPHKQLGSYFGGAVCVADLNGDRKDDVLVGAPYYSKVRDEGRVYIYMNKVNANFNITEGSGHKYDGLERTSDWLEGDGRAGSRFGTTIVNIGDINRDGFTDVAIGAPGGDDGAVFIYNGARSGLRRKYSQVIYASSISSRPKGFGISIASGVDIDGNTYNELAIGAYLEGKAYVFKSRPIIHLITTQTTNISIIPPEKKYINCVWKKVGYHCISLNLNIRYIGEGTPDTLVMETTFSLDHDSIARKRARMVNTTIGKLVSNSMIKISLKRNRTQIVPVTIYISIGLDVDMLKDIKLVSSFKVRHDPKMCGNTPCGILDKYSSQSVTSEVMYEHRCGNDDICDVDLQAQSSILFPNNPGVKKVVYGVVKYFILNSTITNLGEPAFQAKLSTLFSTDFLVDRVEINGKAWPIWKVSKKLGMKELSFLLANPLFQHQLVHVAVKFSVPKTKPSKTTYTFTMEATSTGQEENPLDNKNVIQVKSAVEACVVVQGDVSPAYVLIQQDPKELPKSNGVVDDIGLAIVYNFNIHNAPVGFIAEIKMVTELNDVQLVCISEITIDDVPCMGSISKKSSCQTILENPELYGKVTLEKAEERNLSCANAACETFKCNIKNVQQGKVVSLKIVSRLLDINFVETRKSSLETGALVTFHDEDKDLYIPRQECMDMSGNAFLIVEVPMEQHEAKEIPIWIIILAAIIALILLALLIFVLYKKGFFKRNRMKEVKEEEEPLNE